MRALIIEDDPETVESLSLALQARWPDIEVFHASSGEEGLEMAGHESPDFVILDLLLPGIGGFEVLKEIRRFSSVPLIVLTVDGDEADVVKGLELGADDYLTKPCGQSELLARVGARIRDSNQPPDTLPLSCGPLRFDPVTRNVVCGEREVRLTLIESRILYHLMKNAAHVTTYVALACDVWRDDCAGFIDSLRVHVHSLREKIEPDPGSPRFIFHWLGVGYSFVGPCQPEVPERTAARISEAGEEDVACAHGL